MTGVGRRVTQKNTHVEAERPCGLIGRFRPGSKMRSGCAIKAEEVNNRGVVLRGDHNTEFTVPLRT